MAPEPNAINSGKPMPQHSRDWWSVAGPAGLFMVIWVDLTRQLSYVWRTNEQYAYGWFVPLLALGLFIRKWPSRPEPGTTDYGPGTTDHRPRFLLSAFIFLLCLFLLPLRVIHEINQDWPLISWPLATIVVTLTLYAVYLKGGWAWVRYFGFPICFILVAVQWPYRFEHTLTQGLMRVVAGLSVEILGWLNVPAIQRGNLIEISTGVVGVDEACSGIRSFQSTLMAALFLGELYLLRWPIRVLLVGVGLTLAFLLNVFRAMFLTWQANQHGLPAVDKWHDSAGFSIVAICFVLLWLLTVVLKRRWSRSPVVRGTALSPQESQHSVFSSPVSDGAPPSGTSPWPLVSTPTARYLTVLGVWSLLCVGTTEFWYCSHAVDDRGEFFWSLQLPEIDPSFQTVGIPPRVTSMLRYDSMRSGSWKAGDGGDWTAYFFRWNPKSVYSVLQARLHRPDVCLPASGWHLEDLGLVAIRIGGLEIPFRRYIARSGSEKAFVFYCQWESGMRTQLGMQASRQEDRLRSVFVGRRQIGQQTLELIGAGYPDVAQAEEAFRRVCQGLIRPDKRAELIGTGTAEVRP